MFFAPLIKPDDFANQPYSAGTNQNGHITLCAALVGAASYAGFSVFWSTMTGMGIALIWEAWQFLRKGATLDDYRADLIYWWAGGATWGQAISENHVVGASVLWPAVGIVGFIIEYVRISCKKHTQK